MVLCWFVSNVAEALIGASLVRWLAGASPGLSSVRSVVVFCCAAALAALLSSFLDAGFVRLVGFGQRRLLEPGAGARCRPTCSRR